MTNSTSSLSIVLPESSVVQSWGMSHKVIVPVMTPTTLEEIKSIFAYAKAHKLKVAFRGVGCSYGDASIIDDGIYSI